jgi:hypothetical protein
MAEWSRGCSLAGRRWQYRYRRPVASVLGVDMDWLVKRGNMLHFFHLEAPRKSESRNLTYFHKVQGDATAGTMSFAGPNPTM